MMGTQRGFASAAMLALLLASCARTEAKQASPGTPVARASTIRAEQAPPVSFTDPDDVNLPLDEKTLTHANDDSNIAYTVETYEPFKDSQADFTWELDKNNDQIVDTLVSVEFEEGKLDAKVEDPNEKELGPATVTRTGPNSLRVSFPRRLIGPVATYQYRVTALSDTNGNDESDPGETDVAPDTGFYQHRL
jgi:hypothetical protein